MARFKHAARGEHSAGEGLCSWLPLTRPVPSSPSRSGADNALARNCCDSCCVELATHCEAAAVCFHHTHSTGRSLQGQTVKERFYGRPKLMRQKKMNTSDFKVIVYLTIPKLTWKFYRILWANCEHWWLLFPSCNVKHAQSIAQVTNNVYSGNSN